MANAASGVQVANLLQELPVLRSIEIWAGVGAVPGIDLCLQLIATLQQLRVARGEPLNQSGKTAPEALRLDRRARQGFLVDEFVQDSDDLHLA